MEIIKEKYIWDDGFETTLVYDKDKYAFEFFNDIDNKECSKNIVVRRISDNKIIKIFNKNILFISQNYFGYDNVSDFAVCEEYNNYAKKLNNYYDSDNGLVFSTCMELSDTLIDKIYTNFNVNAENKKSINK